MFVNVCDHAFREIRWHEQNMNKSLWCVKTQWIVFHDFKLTAA